MGARPRPGSVCPLRSRLAAAIAALGAALCCAVAPAGSVAAQEAISPSLSNASAWPQFQGGPDHGGVIDSSTVVPPLRPDWRFEAPGKERGLSPPVIDDGVAIAVGREGVYAVHLADGTLAWQLPRAGGGTTPSPAVATTGRRRVLLFTDGKRAKDARLRAYDIDSQKHLWDADLEDVSPSGVTVDGTRAFVGDRSGTLYGVDVRSGKVAWRFEGSGVVRAPPAVAEGRVYAVSESSTGGAELVAVDEDTGKRDWTFTPRQVSPLASSPTVTNGLVISTFSDRSVHAIGAEGGGERWASSVASGASPFSGSAIVGGDVVISGTDPPSAGTGLYRFSGATGERRWWFQFDSFSLLGSPLVVGRFVLLGMQDGRIAAVDAVTGREVWERATGGGAVGAMAVGGGVIVASKAGSHGGLVGLGPDPSGRLVDVESPTVLHLGTSLLNYGAALLAVGGGVILLAVAFRRLRGRTGTRGERGELA
jgi:outer membrane protein assembly factor BamB